MRLTFRFAPTRGTLLVALLLTAGWVAGAAQMVPAVVTTLEALGLEQRVEIIRDRWGIAHIYAQTEHDLFFAQGYNAARDRLFQFEMWRRQATGTVAEVVGNRELKRDVGTRLHLFRGDLTQELNHYHPRGETIVTAFVNGVNAYIDEALETPENLPIEFKMLGIMPRHWTPAVVVSRHNGLFGNITQEVDNARAVHAIGVERMKDLATFYGGDPILTADPAIDLSIIDERVLEVYAAFRRPIQFALEDIAAPYRRESGALAHLQQAATGVADEDLSVRPEDVGSNNWIVSGRLTKSGKPLLANDPHRAQAAPSLRYWVHLVGPGWNVVGGGEPVLPGISIGHNEHGAWGLTIFGTDTEDLFIYDTNPANPLQYRYNDAWEDMRVVEDTIAVKGEPAVTVELKYTRHGPVLYEDQKNRKAYALRAAWLEVGTAPYLASLRMNQATTWEQFRDACTYSRTPAENMVWADVDGNIGYQAVAIAPRRHNWSGLVPVPGDGRYEWSGYLPIRSLPHALNPEQGFWVTANNYMFPSDYQYPQAQHWTAADHFRASRATELLAGHRPHTVADMKRLQNDDLSLPARSLVPLLSGVRLTEEATSRSRAQLQDWNYVLDKDSSAAAIYEVFQRRVLANMREQFIPKEAREFISLPMSKAIEWLEAPDGRFGEDPIAGRDAVLARSLNEASADLTRRFGVEMSRWRYGDARFHHALIRHPFSGVVADRWRERLDLGPVPRGGDSYTLTATGGGDSQRSGGSFKFIADLANWDHSLGVNNPGQSGDPNSPHYRDLFDLWARGQYFPVLYSRNKVESVAGERLILHPAGGAR